MAEVTREEVAAAEAAWENSDAFRLRTDGCPEMDEMDEMEKMWNLTVGHPDTPSDVLLRFYEQYWGAEYVAFSHLNFPVDAVKDTMLYMWEYPLEGDMDIPKAFLATPHLPEEFLHIDLSNDPEVVQDWVEGLCSNPAIPFADKKALVDEHWDTLEEQGGYRDTAYYFSPVDPDYPLDPELVRWSKGNRYATFTDALAHPDCPADIRETVINQKRSFSWDLWSLAQNPTLTEAEVDALMNRETNVNAVMEGLAFNPSMPVHMLRTFLNPNGPKAAQKAALSNPSTPIEDVMRIYTTHEKKRNKWSKMVQIAVASNPNVSDEFALAVYDTFCEEYNCSDILLNRKVIPRVAWNRILRTLNQNAGQDEA